MSIDQKAQEDYDRAILKSIWRTIVTWLTGESNELLPFDEVRDRLPLRGQHYLGLRQISIDQIVGSMGRYRDFDRVFLPRQTRTKDRWVNIDKAHYADVILPPVELYKMGEVYFVKDGNHRVSVARERGQIFVDAYVTEMEISVPLPLDTNVTDLDLKREYAIFIEETDLLKIRPDARVELTLPGEYERLLEHVNVHRWYLGEQRGAEVPYAEAVASWYDNVYAPLVEMITDQDLVRQFPGRTAADLYLWIIEYQWYRREAYKEDFAFEQAARLFIENYAEWPAGKLVSLLKQAAWVDNLILDQERNDFLLRTHLAEIRPGAYIELTVPGLYEKLLEHVSVHRWYLGEQRGAEVPYQEAVASWYDNVYLPLVKVIREHRILAGFPGRTESDLYLWIIEHQALLREVYGGDIPLEQAADHFKEDYSPDPVQRIAKNSRKKSAGKD